MNTEEMIIILDERAARQMQAMIKSAKELLGTEIGWTEEDLLQPQDFPELETSPYFRYEEGILHGILIAKSLLSKSLVV